MTIEQEIWDEFKELSEFDISSDKASYQEAKQYFGVQYEDSIETIPRINSNRYIQEDIDSKIEKALNSESVDWDNVIKIYPVRPERTIKEAKYPEPTWRSKKERIEIGNILMLNYGSAEGLKELFLSENEARKYLAEKRWGDNCICPYCSSSHITEFNYSSERKLHNSQFYKCNTCRNNFSATVRTVFENTKVPLTKWFNGIYLLTSTKTRKLSSYQLSTAIGVSQLTAWRMGHKIKSVVNDPIFVDIRNGLFKQDVQAHQT